MWTAIAIVCFVGPGYPESCDIFTNDRMFDDHRECVQHFLGMVEEAATRLEEDGITVTYVVSCSTGGDT